MNKIIESKKFLNWSVFVCWLLNFLQHLPSFFRSVFTGDERVYLSLSHLMGWDLSNYTTMYDPIISQLAVLTMIRLVDLIEDINKKGFCGLLSKFIQ